MSAGATRAEHAKIDLMLPTWISYLPLTSWLCARMS